jgi:hypothetical protein
MTREETLKGLRCCSEFECGECPYKIYDDHTYTLRCTHRLIVDLQALELKTGTWKGYSSTMMECSECNKHVPYHRYEFCPDCGAKMKEENTDE